MTKLHLGVFDVPYADNPGVTTGDVAEQLEAKYHPMETFVDAHKTDIADDLANSYAGALESILMGAPTSLMKQAGAGAMSSVQNRFKTFLSTSEMESMGIPGVPTQAALDGVNHRLKSKRGGRRPSFIDTGLYMSSTRSWID